MQKRHRTTHLDEGAWDDVRDGIRRLSSFVTRQFGEVAARWGASISKKLDAMSEMPADVMTVFAAVKAGMQETGESIKMDAALRDAQELGRLGRSGILAVVDDDLMGPVKEKAALATEGLHVRTLYLVLSENAPPCDRDQLDESLTVGSVLGVGLAIMGGFADGLQGAH
jgi:hypothetical protein